MPAPLICLRPSFCRLRRPSAKASLAYLKFYDESRAAIALANILRASSSTATAASPFSLIDDSPPREAPRIRVGTTKDGPYERLSQDPSRLWPRMPKQENVKDIRFFRHEYGILQRGITMDDLEVTLRGRIWGIRSAGAKLVFVDLIQDGVLVQCVLNRGYIKDPDMKTSGFRAAVYDLHRGDSISIRGHPHRTSTNELSLLANQLPLLLSRCAADVPGKIENKETKMQSRYVDFLIERLGAQTLQLRAEILESIRQFFKERRFVDVQTPILADAAGGATARPFQTTANEFGDRGLALRIAPELWLKKLIIGGFERIYEIGPSFRNEGIDLTHNPEFWTCEFYKAYADLDELILITEDLFSRLGAMSRDLKLSTLSELKGCDVTFKPPYPRLDFILTLENAMACKLPILTSTFAESTLAELLRLNHVQLPDPVTIPRMLDKLSAKYLEPKCKDPTWIINHPECLSPLSKSFDHPQNGQRVAARAELFVKGQELVNCYEEENSPLEQRRKFEDQLRFKDPDTPAKIDESYLEALQWGMPPTGGWGCGIERLVMLFAGTNRIADTISFGTLRHVVSRSQESSLLRPKLAAPK